MTKAGSEIGGDKTMLSANQRRELLGLGLLALTVFTTLSLLPPAILGEAGTRLFPSGNVMGSLGRMFGETGVRLAGAGLPLVPPLIAVAGAACFGWIGRGRALRWAVFLLGLGIAVPVAAAVVVVGGGSWAAAGVGWLGDTLASPLIRLLGWFGAALVLFFLVAALAVATVGWSPARAAAAGMRGSAKAVGAVRRRVRQGETAGGSGTIQDELAAAAESNAVRVGVDEPEPAALEPPAPEPHPALAPPAAPEPAASAEAGKGPVEPPEGEEPAAKRAATRKLFGRKEKKPKRDDAVERRALLELEDPGHPESADRPSLKLLSAPPARDIVSSERELDRLGNVVVEKLRTFKVESEIVGRTTGPVVTQFEVVPAPGIKVNRIAALDADLTLALKAPSVRIVAPIPGKGAVGVEVPNPEAEIVHLREILQAPGFQRGRSQLPLALGKDLTGRPYVADLARMPHLLIAGATGSGKSVCINSLITSLVYRHSPRTMRLLLIDPKMVELMMYGGLPHLRHPVVTDPSDAAVVLKWAVLEMERRYELLSENGARSILEFNHQAAEGQPLRRVEPEGEEGDPDRWVYTDGPLPYIVVVVDELADLMMTVQAEIEKPLTQLAQKARAIGIHLIVATQRPSVNVITGLIKANFPSRIAFRVSSKVDSRTILDQNGADALLGNGDMLFLPPGQSDPIRIQGAFLPTSDTESLMRWYRERPEAQPEVEEDILDLVRSREAEESGEDLDTEFFEERDPLFRQAAEVCIQFQQGSTSLLQRRLRIGYGRAARIIDQLHNAGVLGPPDGSKPREVLIGFDSLDGLLGDS